MSIDEKRTMSPAPTSRVARRRYITVIAACCFIGLLYTLVRQNAPAIRIRRLPSGYHIDWSDNTYDYAGVVAEQERAGFGQQGKTSEHIKLEADHGKGSDSSLTKYTTTIVLGRLEKELSRVQWVYDDLANITNTAVYIVDNAQSDQPHLQRNHGREAMVYLLYIIENYDNLNDITFFWHSDKKVWHNNILLGENSVDTINMMDRDYIMEQGYVPSRCDHWPGCPSWIKFNPTVAEHFLDEHRLADMFNTKTFQQLFPEEYDYPRYFAETCCSQFAVTRETIRSVPKAEYERIRDWIDEWFSDQFTGRALEMMWQYIFMRKGEYCPSMQDCYCKTYGICINDKKELAMLERWNELRTRAEEYQWQEYFRDRYVRDHTSGSEDEKARKVQEDGEYQRILEEEAELKKKASEYKAMITKHWNLPKSEVEW